MQQSEHPASQIVHPSASTATTPAPTAPTGFSLGPAPTTTPTPTPAATPAASTFSFGPAPTPAPAVATRSFSFGPTPTPAPATATPPQRGFNFGPAPTPAAAAAPATSFSFGRPAPTPAPAAASTASFNFGPAPTAAPAIATPPQRGFSFGAAPTPAATHWVRDPVTNTNDEFHCITAHPDYSMASLEELRWQAYAMKPCLGLASTTEQSEEPVVSLQNAMQALLVDPTFADVTFEVDGEEVRAHRSILSARSPTFKAMFTSGLSESAEGAVIKLDCNKRIFEDVLKYIYTGQVSFSDVDTAIEMLGRAEEYFLPGLKKECENVLVNQYLTEDTATSLIVVADMYRTPALKKACVDFILRNTQSVNVAELDKAMLAELLVAACSITPHRPAFPTPVPRTTGPFSAWGGSTTTLAAAPTPPAFG